MQVRSGSLRVLVTGVAGLVGRVTARELIDHGHRVRGVDVLVDQSGLRDCGMEMVYADVADQLAMLRAVEDCDAVVHCAAYPTPHNKMSSELLRVNVIGTQNLLDAAVAQGVSTAVITSSIGALGFSFPKHPCLPDYLPVDTDHPRRPQDVYGVSKVMNEESAAAVTRASGLATIIIRPPWVVDLERMGDSPWLKHRIEHLSEHRSEDLWGYIEVRDLAVAYRLVVEKKQAGHSTFFIMADDVLAKIDAPELIRRFLPDRVSDIPKLTGNSLYDLSPARDILGFKHKHVWRDYDFLLGK